MTRTRSVVASGAATFSWRAVLSAIGFAGAVLITRLLGPEGRGLYSVVLVAAAVLIAVAKLGLEQTNVFLVGSRRIAVERLAGQNLVVAFLVGAPIGFLLLAAPAALPAVFADVAPPLLLMGALMVPVSLHTQLTAGLQNLTGEVTWQFKAAVLAGLAQLALIVGLAAVNAITLTTALAASLAGFVVLWLLTLTRSGAGYLKIRWDGRLMRETLARTLVLHVAMLLLFLHLRVDMLMIKGISGAYALGQYSLAVVLAETVLLAPDSLSIALLPKQTRNTFVEAAALAIRAARANFVIAAVLALGWAAVGRPVIGLFFGSDFLPAFDPLLALLPGMVFFGIQRVCGAPILRADAPGRMAVIYAATLTLNVGLNLLWIPGLGPTGAGLASSVSYGIGALAFFAWTCRLADVPFLVALRPSAEDYTWIRAGIATALRAARQRGTSD